MKLRKKKAFTLTELLVVVVVIGVLSAVVLPKFNKVMETRKTTEAEEIMAAIRTEQERRCALDKRYHSEMAAMSDLVPETTTKYYAYNLTNTGVEAATTNNNKYSYTLVMPSYADGRIACEGADCSKLNKNYPSKDELLSKSDYQNTPVECNAWMECTGDAEKPCGWSGSGKQTRECDHTTGTWSAWSDCSEPPCNPDAKPTDSRSCGCKNEGTQTRVSEPVCDPNTHTWSNPSWGACSDTRTGEQCCGTPTTTKQCGCENKGTKTRSASCTISTGVWSYGSYGSCSIEDCDCSGDACCKGQSKPNDTQTYVHQGHPIIGCSQHRSVTCQKTGSNSGYWKTGDWVPPSSCRWLRYASKNYIELYGDSFEGCKGWNHPERWAAYGYNSRLPHPCSETSYQEAHACGEPVPGFKCLTECNESTGIAKGLICRAANEPNFF